VRTIHQHRSHVFDELAGATLDEVGTTPVEFENPVRHVKEPVDERADREPARHLASGVTAHAVGDSQHVVDLLGAIRNLARGEATEHGDERSLESCDVELVLVGGSHVAAVRYSVHLDADQRRRRAKRRNLDMGLRVVGSRGFNSHDAAPDENGPMVKVARR
jgi:hypothetical protein